MGFGGMAMGFSRVLCARGVVTLAMVFGRGSMRFRSLVVVTSRFGMRSFRHGDFLLTSPASGATTTPADQRLHPPSKEGQIIPH